MAIIPKNTKYHYRFRNKYRNQKVVKADIRARYVFGKNRADHNRMFKINAWYHKHGAAIPSGNPPSAVSNGFRLSTPPQTTDDAITHNFVSHVYTKRLLFGNHGIICETHGVLPVRWVKTVTLDIAKKLKKKSKVWLRFCCDTPVTARPVETRMGKGKGAISYWETKVTPGMVLFEFSGTSSAGVQSILRSLQQKTSLRLRHVRELSHMPLV